MDRFEKTITKKTVVILDKAPIHKSKKFKEKMIEWREKDLFIYFFSPYFPELNLIEILWKRIKYQWMPFDAYVSFKNLKECLLQVLNNVGTKYDIKF